MAFIPLKATLVVTNFSILFLLITILIKHTSYGFNILSWSTGFNILCVLWLSLRGAFWVLTLCSIDYWIGSTFYILYWVPTPICFGAFMLIPLFFAHLLYRKQWEYYWSKIWWIYAATMTGLALFMISWSVLSAMNLRHDLECISASRNIPNSKPVECNNTEEFSSTVFRGVTAVCFLFLSINCAMFGKKILALGDFDTSIFIGPSVNELYKVNLFLFASFLSRGLYECLDVIDLFHMPSIPLQGEYDVSLLTFFVFMMWDYFPTLLWIVVVTGRDVVWGISSATSRPTSTTPLGTSVRNTISYDRLSDLNDVRDEEFELPYFQACSGERIVGTPAKNLSNLTRGEISRVRPVRPPRIDNSGVESESLGRRFAPPSTLAPINSWLTSEENGIQATLLRGRSGSTSGGNRSLIYGTFGEDMASGSASSTYGNPLQNYSSFNVPGSPQMPWPESFPKGGTMLPPVLEDSMLPPIITVPGNDVASNSASFRSVYYSDENITTPTALTGSSPLLRPSLTSPGRAPLFNQSTTTNAPPIISLQLPVSYAQTKYNGNSNVPNSLLETALNGQDHLNSLAASFPKRGGLLGEVPMYGISPGGTAPLSARSIRSRSNTYETGYEASLLPPPTPSNVSGEALQTNGVHMGIWRAPMGPPIDKNKRLLNIAASNLTIRRGGSSEEIISPRAKIQEGALDGESGVYNASYSSSSQFTSSQSNSVIGQYSPRAPPPPPLPPIIAAWDSPYYTEELAAYSERTAGEGGRSPEVRAK